MLEPHDGLDQLGPGSRASTLRALHHCEALPPRPAVLDLGCGTGAQTLHLASVLEGRIVAVDLFEPLL